MASTSMADQLEDAIEMMIAEPESAPPKVDLKISELLGIAAELRLLPDPEFRAELKADLLKQNHAVPVAANVDIHSQTREQRQARRDLKLDETLPTLFAEKRLLSYAADLGLLVDEKQKSEKRKITKIMIAHGTMTQMTEEREEHIYTIRNRDTSPRIVVIEHPARQGWKLADGTEPVESTASFYRFHLTAEPKKTTIVSVKEYRPISTRYQLTNVSDSQVDYFLSQKAINVDVEKILRRVVGQKNSIAALETDIAARKAQMSSIAEDQQRVRENMKALKGSAEEKALLERYARELNDQEDRVQFLQHETSDLQQKRDAAQKALTEMIEGLEMEAIL